MLSSGAQAGCSRALPGVGAGEKLGGVRLGGTGPTKHLADLLHARVGIKRRHLRGGAVAAYRLTHAILAVAERGDLRQVGDAEHLMRLPQLPELLADHLAAAPADTCVNFIEYEDGHGVGT